MRKTQGKRRLGKRLVAELAGLRDALRDKRPIEKLYTVRNVELDLKPKKFDAESIRVIRMSLGVSQTIFAHLLGVSNDLVGSWEQGYRVASGPVCRLLELIEIDKNRWLRMLEQSQRNKPFAQGRGSKKRAPIPSVA
jgi:DNA-binding transcriptional regulator YiaG